MRRKQSTNAVLVPWRAVIVSQFLLRDDRRTRRTQGPTATKLPPDPTGTGPDGLSPTPTGPDAHISMTLPCDKNSLHEM